MKPTATILCVFLFLLGSVSLCLAADEPELLKDSKREKIYKVIVNPNLKPFLVHLIYKNATAPEIHELVVRQLKIYTQGSKSPVQVLPANMLYPPYQDEQFFLTEDFNFDGYDDLMLLEGWGARLRQYEIWLFDPKSKRFIYNADLSDLMSPNADKNKKIITTWYNRGSAARDYQYTEYKWKGKRLIKILEVDQKGIEENKFHKIIKELHNGKLEVTTDKILSDEAATEENHKGTQLYK